MKTEVQDWVVAIELELKAITVVVEEEVVLVDHLKGVVVVVVAVAFAFVESVAAMVMVEKAVIASYFVVEEPFVAGTYHDYTYPRCQVANRNCHIHLELTVALLEAFYHLNLLYCLFLYHVPYLLGILVDEVFVPFLAHSGPF